MQRQYTFLVVLMLLFLTFTSIKLNAKKGQTLIKGTITNTTNGKIESVEIVFKDSNGKKFSTKSNSITGKYEQLLRSDEKYKIYFKRFDVLREEIEITPKKGEEIFTEQPLDFQVKLLKKGATLAEYDLFESNSANILPRSESQLKKLKKLLKFNRAIKVTIQVSGSDSESNSSLVDARLSAIKELVSKWRNFNKSAKLIVENNYSNANNDAHVIISQVKDLMK